MSASLKSNSDIRSPSTLAWKLPETPSLNISIFDSGYHSGESSMGSSSSTEDNKSFAVSKLQTRASKPPQLAQLPFFAPLCSSLGAQAKTPGAGMRLPPSIITRQMPLPIQNLPTLSPSVQTPPDNKIKNFRRPSLQSLPSLTRIGREAPPEIDSDMEDINEDDEEEEDSLNADQYDESAEMDAPESPTSSNSNSIASVRTQINPDMGHLNVSIMSSDDRTTDNEVKPQTGNVESLPTPRPSRASSDSDHDGYFTLDTSFLLPIINVTTAAAAPSASAVQPSGSTPRSQNRARGSSESNVYHDPPRATRETQPTTYRHTLDLGSANARNTTLAAPAAPSLIPTPSPPDIQLNAEHRPTFYRQESQSMANLTAAQLDRAVASAAQLTSQYDGKSQQQLKRQTSMPQVHPPTYVSSQRTVDPHFAHFANFRPSPREEEGMERLPPYDLTVPLLSGLLLRKEEFSKAGILSKDRNWHRVWCVLQGTSFKIYEGEKGIEKIGGWIGRKKERIMMMDEKNKGKGKAEEPIRITAIVPGSEADTRPKFTVTSASDNDRPRSRSGTRSSRASMSSMSSMHSPYASSSRTSMSLPDSGDSPISSSNSNLEVPNAAHRRTFSSAMQMIKTNVSERRANMRARASMSTTSLTPDTSMGRSMSPFSPISGMDSDMDMPMDQFDEISGITQRQLLRHYTLQNAESGVAIDYHKKPNVIRLRLEGEQFLLQVKGVKEVVEWIEGFQSAADIALDLDERPMPRGPMFPRRRRRRPRVSDPYASQSASANTSEAEH